MSTTEQDIREALDRDRFAAYLAARDARAFAGFACRSTECPLAFYLYDALGSAACVAVTDEAVVVDGALIESPVWVSAFVTGIDGAKGREAEVTFHEALAALGGVL